MKKSNIILAHYYTIPEVQNMADFVGDSLDLSIQAQQTSAYRIVFAGVRFMAETAKLLNPHAEVILPDYESSCSLVEQTDFNKLKAWDITHRSKHENVTHVMYINSSMEMKSLADIIVTSRNVEEIIQSELDAGNTVIFSPDHNMGNYLNKTNGWDMPIWSAVCEVHEKFNLDKLYDEIDTVMRNSMMSDIPQIIAHPESPLDILLISDFVGSTSKMLEWIVEYKDHDTVFVATEDGILYNMRKLRPDLTIIQAPTYAGCQCNTCPFMKMNTVKSVENALAGISGHVIKLPDNSDRSKLPIMRMLQL